MRRVLGLSAPHRSCDRLVTCQGGAWRASERSVEGSIRDQDHFVSSRQGARITALAPQTGVAAALGWTRVPRSTIKRWASPGGHAMSREDASWGNEEPEECAAPCQKVQPLQMRNSTTPAPAPPRPPTPLSPAPHLVRNVSWRISRGGEEPACLLVSWALSSPVLLLNKPPR